MIENFPLLRQSPDSNACFPTCVRAVLLWQGERVTQDEISEWCQETVQGCVLDLAIDGLREADIDVEEIVSSSAEAEDALRQYFVDAEAQPLIVTLHHPVYSDVTDHAVVVTGIRYRGITDSKREIVEYMDPLIGDLVQDASGDFWDYWYQAGQRAFLLRP